MGNSERGLNRFAYYDGRVESVELGAVSKDDQTQSPSDLFLIFAGANIVATTLQMGTYLPAFTLTTTMLVIAAGAIGGALLVAVLAPIGSALRVPSIVATRAALGFQGAQVVAFLLFATNFVWIAVNNAIAASITARLVSGPAAEHQAAWAVFFGIVATLTVLGGPRAVGLADRAAVPLLLTSGVVLTLACLRATIPAVPAPATSAIDMFHGFDLIFGYQTTWLLMFADYSRYTRSGKQSGIATFGGLGLTALWFIPLGLIASRVASSGDPGAMLFALGLGWWGAILVTLGTLTTNFVNIYMSALALKSLRPATSNRAAIWIIGGIGCALSVLSQSLLDRLGGFTVALAGLFVPIGGLLIAHFVFLGRKDAPAALYPAAPGVTPAVGNWSVAGMTAWIAGAAAFYLSQRLGGVVPGLVVSIAVYLVLARRR
jgi:purine-cytosine permease-like protein